MTRTLSGLYESPYEAQNTVRDLEAAGIARDHISMLANNADDHATKVKEGNEAGKGAEGGAVGGAVIGGAAGLLAGIGAIAIPGVGPVVAAGWIAATLAGAAGGAVVGGATGGIVGSMVSNGVPEADAHVYAEGIRRGGSLVSVRVDEAQALTAQAILDRHHRIDPQRRGAAYRESGWSRFDENGEPYTAPQIERERGLYRGDARL